MTKRLETYSEVFGHVLCEEQEGRGTNINRKNEKKSEVSVNFYK